ncbi:MAG: DNA polymerase ligase N-terminal domain-containing protein [Nitrospiria bacterium]
MKTKHPLFNVQKHLASHLHYDFRLEMNGVLKSWAIPKGPSLDPVIKRLAIEVEDHELSYANFEGVIEEGEYGGGPVIVWDTGKYDYLPDANGLSVEEALEHGKIEFFLHGSRLKGHFILLKLKSRPRQWLLIKAKDDEARPGSEITEEYENSVITGRSLYDLQKEDASGKLKRHRCK